ncbi:uncharacterized protein TRIREDRAFT_62633 [Trichoderma reesei QM6a]|uniref:ubiquitinyl hydrolase 1 n=1 Tax=Hypocrea jecorina (strain QM6a) TaxID=431241 RepID=G0RKQ2_HYPJQ|nr:uncharacterized protein TRIREDRAFT_62633 [Trichoderma reesei QM6a]EGR48358.1 predicted protein [Trichoderma reesei QM6a]
MASIRSIIEHAVLPPKIPGAKEDNYDAMSSEFLNRLEAACERVKGLASSPFADAFHSLSESLRACRALNQEGLDRVTLLEHFRTLGTNDVLICHVVEQNAAILIRREIDHKQEFVVFESFETSPTTEHVLAADNALVWDFPGRAVRLSAAEFSDEELQKNVAEFLEKASREAIHTVQAQARKAQVSVVEARDTADPAVITQLFMIVLEGIGESVNVPKLRKRVRDDVNFAPNAILPWRRLPFWLVLRVATQRHLHLSLGKSGRASYKLLMCVFFSRLLQDASAELSRLKNLEPDLVITLQVKLCRRMAKAEKQKAGLSSRYKESFENVFDNIVPGIEDSIQQATKTVQSLWENFKSKTKRRIRALPAQASEDSLRLSLLNSGSHLKKLLENYKSIGPVSGTTSLRLPSSLDRPMQEKIDFNQRIYALDQLEMGVEKDVRTKPTSEREAKEFCQTLARDIHNVFSQVGSLYDGDPLQQSIKILTIFELWVRMDECAIGVCPLLRGYCPIFTPELLDALQLPTLAGMSRLQTVQLYIATRQKDAKHAHILRPLAADAFSCQYVRQSEEMRRLMGRIQACSDADRASKEAAWKQETNQYKDYTEKINSLSCLCTWNGGVRNVSQCKRCLYYRRRKRLEVKVHEDFLPEDELKRQSIVFELAIPSFLSAYRNATWVIVRDLAHPHRQPSASPRTRLEKCPPLQHHMTANTSCVTFASAKKCFTETHYSFNSGLVPLAKILLPFAADFDLYDSEARLWVADLNKPLTLHHLCGVHIPSGLSSTVMRPQSHPAPDVDGPSSYETQANMTRRPPHLSAAEFSAYQKLMSGKSRRWINILVELGSSNLNFSNEDTALMLSQLAFQAGPRSRGVLRSIHAVMEEREFVTSLGDQIKNKLSSICSNWRETNCMELLINLTLRMFSLLPQGEMRDQSKHLLDSARAAILEWIAQLQIESRKAEDGAVAGRLARFGLKAALLCRRTFATHLDTGASLTSFELLAWVKASVALQENLTTDINNMPKLLKSMMIRDAKMAHRLENLLHVAIETHYEVLQDALGLTGQSPPEAKVHQKSPWTHLPRPNSHWTVYQTESYGCSQSSQVFHFNILEGHFLVNGRPRGSLPQELRNDPSVRALFGDRNLFVYPSAVPGMTHRLADLVEGHAIHFGKYKSHISIRAITRDGDQLDFINSSIFRSPDSDSFDLPASLLEDCTHWLNSMTGVIEVRRRPWVRQWQDWHIDLRSRRATRGENIILVDPRSYEFRQISEVFEHFEQPENLTVIQSRRGKLAVQLHHLDLSFHVNKARSLYSRELKASIDFNQDVGTWYGLASKIVVRDVKDKTRRSIIIPIGELTWSRNKHGIHVFVGLKRTEGYCRFEIDDILGRLSSPPERRLLVLKALCHAATSFCLPDPLTGRTGTEEALQILGSGAAQPWDPLTSPDMQTLARLLPRREYYPQDIKRLQRVTWDPSLTTTIQNDAFEQFVRSMEGRATLLARFSSVNVKPVSSVGNLSQLRHRAQIRRQLYERPVHDTATLKQTEYTYPVRDKRTTQRSDRVYLVVKLLRAPNLLLNMNSTLAKVLESWTSINGFCSGDSSWSIQPLAIQVEEPISSRWGSLVSMFRNTEDAFLWAFQLGLLAFNPRVDMDILVSLVGFCRIKQIRQLEPPLHATFTHFKDRGPPSADTLEALISQAFVPLQIPKGKKQSTQSEKETHQERCKEQGKILAKLLSDRWPHLPPDAGFTGNWEPTAINVPLVLKNIKPEWDRRCHNDQLWAYVNRIDSILRQHSGRRFEERPQRWIHSVPTSFGKKDERTIPSISQGLVTKPCPRLERFKVRSLTEPFESTSSLPGKGNRQERLPEEVFELEDILTSFSRSSNDLRRSYGQDLLGSLAAFKTSYPEPFDVARRSNPSAETVANAINGIQSMGASYRDCIQKSLWAADLSSKWLTMGNLLPCSTTVEMLELLRSKANHQFGPGMKDALILYGCAIAELQRLRRLRTAILRRDQRGVEEELRNVGHENWDPAEENPDWLLLELDSNILIRADQINVARATLNPASGENSLLQLNMGRGKTSCILPMAAAVVANGTNLSRLVVPKSLIMQTAQMMHARLGGLVGRAILHIPFSRQTPTSDDVLQAYCELHREVQSSQGLILTSHEHILSYRLSGLQRLADNKLAEAEKMVNFQTWLDAHCRDLLDESDFTLSPKTQLNYPSGEELPIDGHPFRWQVAQGLLAMVAEYMPQLEAGFPGSIEVVGRSSWFPSVQFLRSDVEDELDRLIVEDTASGKVPFLHMDKAVHKSAQIAIKRVLTEERCDNDLLDKASQAFTQPNNARTKLLVIRGLIVHKILILCLGKRWNVQYGLHPNRPPVAVPFAAKGVPSELSEYGHPDVAILLTCLSFYSTGLTFGQFREGLKRILTSEDAALEYERWISESNLPPALESWNLINLDDELQMQVLWQHLRKNRVVTNHYMNNFVFPDHARQFAVKLQASAWDVPLKSSDALPGARTTGFSGTNDNKYMLPMTIQQEDLPGLVQTNAEVLSYLLQCRNRGYAVLTDRNNRRLSEFEMLKMLHRRGIKVLIDAGAYILETGNGHLARMWFDIDPLAQSAVYFRDDNRAWVAFRDAAKPEMPLLATRLANDLTDCFVYFDEAHTRGVDLKLPEDARAALTLALKQTKDNTMQAAMRLRQLGTTQSVTFFAPPEVDISIRDIRTRINTSSTKQEIQSPDVIFWLLEQTCLANEDLRPLFLAQGMDFCRRESALLQFPNYLTSTASRSKLLKLLQEPEHQTLDQLYGAVSGNASLQSVQPLHSRRLQKFADKLSSYHDTGIVRVETLGEVEQERAVEVQIEAVREVEKPVHYQALKFPGLKSSISRFLRTGVLDTSDGETIHALDYIGRTKVGRKFGIHSSGSRLFVSPEFCRSIVLPKLTETVEDRFLRPVEWILWSPSTQTALVVIPEEVELLIPELRSSPEKAKIHLIAYAAPVTRAMVPFNELRYYSFPPIPAHTAFPTWLKVELGILAGRLYTDYEEWKLTDDYIRRSQAGKLTSPAFLLEWVGVRCRAHDVLHTPIGYICLGRAATESHPFFVRSEATVTPQLPAAAVDDDIETPESEAIDGDVADEIEGEDRERKLPFDESSDEESGDEDLSGDFTEETESDDDEKESSDEE